MLPGQCQVSEIRVALASTALTAGIAAGARPNRCSASLSSSGCRQFESAQAHCLCRSGACFAAIGRAWCIALGKAGIGAIWCRLQPCCRRSRACRSSWCCAGRTPGARCTVRKRCSSRRAFAQVSELRTSGDRCASGSRSVPGQCGIAPGCPVLLEAQPAADVNHGRARPVGSVRGQFHWACARARQPRDLQAIHVHGSFRITPCVLPPCVLTLSATVCRPPRGRAHRIRDTCGLRGSRSGRS